MSNCDESTTLYRRAFLALIGVVPLLSSLTALGTASESGDGSEAVAVWPDPSGDDHGPGSYTYPTDDAIEDGAFDLLGVELRRRDDEYVFLATIDELGDPDDAEFGYSPQFLQLYVRDPRSSDEASATDARTGVNATFEAPYHRRILANGHDGAWIEDGSGDEIATGTTSVVGDAIEIVVPEEAFESDLEDLAVAPLLLGYDDGEPGSVMPVESTAADRTFGGGEDDDTNPNVIDAITPESVDQADALAYDEDQQATIPYVTVEEGIWHRYGEGTTLARWNAPEGTDHGPGSYEYPDGLPFEPGALDLVSFDAIDHDDRYVFRLELAEELTNPWGLEHGFSLQFPQVYLRDSIEDGGTTAAREGVNARFEEPYHYRIVANGVEGRLEDVDGNTVTDDVEVRGLPDPGGIVVSIPADAVDAQLAHLEVAPLMLGYLGEADGDVRPVTADGDDGTFAGGRDDDANPNVIDLVVPEHADRSTALEYTTTEPATLPYLSIRRALLDEHVDGEEVLYFPDERGTDYGPGSYEYPQDLPIKKGDLDLHSLSLYESDETYSFVVTMRKEFEDPFDGPDGYSAVFPQIYIRDTTRKNGSTTARKGVEANFKENYHYRLLLPPYSTTDTERSLENSDEDEILSNINVTVVHKSNSILGEIPKKDIDLDFSSAVVTTIITGFMPEATSGVRQVTSDGELNDGDEWLFSGGRDDDMNPNVIDVLTPPGVDQEDALAYDEDQQATIPFRELSVRESIVGHRDPRPEHARSAREYWAIDDPVPGTEGDRVRYAQVREFYRDATE